MRFTSANAEQIDTALPGALYDVIERKQASKIDFLEALFLREAKGRLRKTRTVSGA
jgi:hypothetical protein